jgi:hypothetical protein
MKKFIPYILAYIIVASGTAVYPHIYAHFTRSAPIVYHNAVAIVLTHISQINFTNGS